MPAKRSKRTKKKPSRVQKRDRHAGLSRRAPRKAKASPAKPKDKHRREKKKDLLAESTTSLRLWLFRITALTIVPALLFGCLEIALRIAGCGFPATATVEHERNGQDAYCDNVKFTWRFFPPAIAREFDPFIFQANKPENTYRIFILGGSAAQGVPEPAFGFSRHLSVMLQDKYPHVDFEVINVATAAINSHVALEIAKDCARHEPDLFVVYLGNNEVVGPYGAGSVFAPVSSNLSLVRLGMAVEATRIGQMLTDLLRLTGAGKDTPVVWRGMEMFLEKQVRADGASLKTVYQHFKRNLQDISDAGKNSGAKIIFCTVPSNLKDCPPFASLHRGDLTETEKNKWNDIYQQGIEFELAGNYAGAIQRFVAAAKIDTRYADLHFRLGRCRWATGEYGRARESYIHARELDTLRFRADNRINGVIREVATDRIAEGVYLADAVRAFEENSPHRVPGKELFHEHVHLNFNGSYLLAKAVLNQTERILSPWITNRKLESASDRGVLTQERCAQRLAYNDWTRYNIACAVLNASLKQAPFTNQLYHDEQLAEFRQKIALLKASLTPEVLGEIATQYREAIRDRPSDWWLRWQYASLLSVDLNEQVAAVEQYRAVQKLLPHSYKPRLSLGMALARIGQLDEAEQHLQKVLRIKPTSARAYAYLGSIHQVRGRLDRAAKCYSTAVELQPNYADAYNNLAGVLSLQGKLDRAVQLCREALLFVPDDADLRYNLALLLRKQGHSTEAVRELQAVLQSDPNSIRAQKLLQAILQKQR